MNKPTAFRIPTDMVEKIDGYREGKEWSRSAVVRIALNEFLGKADTTENKDDKKDEKR